MKKVELGLPEILFIAVTRGLLGAGIGLLVAGGLSRRHRRRVGATLFAIGVVTTIPAALMVFRPRRGALSAQT